MNDLLRAIFRLKNKESFITGDLFLNMLKLIVVHCIQFMIKTLFLWPKIRGHSVHWVILYLSIYGTFHVLFIKSKGNMIESLFSFFPSFKWSALEMHFFFQKFVEFFIWSSMTKSVFFHLFCRITKRKKKSFEMSCFMW